MQTVRTESLLRVEDAQIFMCAPKNNRGDSGTEPSDEFSPSLGGVDLCGSNLSFVRLNFDDFADHIFSSGAADRFSPSQVSPNLGTSQGIPSREDPAPIKAEDFIGVFSYGFGIVLSFFVLGLIGAVVLRFLRTDWFGR